MARLPPGPRLRGRQVELRALGETLDRVASGRSAIVLVEGEAGIGKTRLLAEALEQARARGVRVMAGRAEALERTRPFGLVADTLGCVRSSSDPRRAAIATLLATKAGDRGPMTVSSDPGLQFQAVDAFVDLVETLALDRPLVVGVDDLQWADPSSLLTLGTLGRRLVDVPLALIGCLRPSPHLSDLEQTLQALEHSGAQRLALGQLDQQAVVGLVAEAVAAEPGPGLLAEVQGAGGNPLFVTELVAARVEEGAIRTVDGRAEVAELSLPPSLRLTILRRLSLLPEATLEALRSASILGSSFALADLSSVTGRAVGDLAAVLAEAVRARFLEDDGDRLRFRHDLIRDAIYQDLPASVRLGLHREAGQRLATAGASALRVAEHVARGATQGHADAIAWLVMAAREATPKSPTIAADLLERAIGLSDPADPARDGLLAERAGALMWAGRLADAEATCRALLARDHDPSVEGPTRLVLARTLATQGRIRDALPELERVQQSPAVSDELRAGAWGAEAMARLELGDLAGAMAVAEQATGVAAVPGDHPALTMARTSLAMAEELRANLSRGLQIIDEAVRLADQHPERRGHRYPLHLVRGSILMDLDRLQDARSALQTGRRISEELGVRWRLPLYQVFLAIRCFLAGEWDDAIAEVEAAVALTAETGERYSLVLGHSVTSLIALHRGDLREAGDAAASAERELADTGPRYRSHWAMWSRALLLEAAGATQEAFATLAGVWDLCASSGLAVDFPLLGADLIRLALAAGEQPRSRRVAIAVAEVAARNDVPSLAGAALRCRGMVEDDPEILRAAVDAYEQAPRPLELALAAEDAGASFARRGKADAAVALLQQALGTYERLDAVRDLDRTQAKLRGLGVRHGRRGARQRPQIGWESLTPPSTGSWSWSPKACPAPKSANGCTCRPARCRPIWPTSSPSSASRPAPSSPPRRPDGNQGDPDNHHISGRTTSRHLTSRVCRSSPRATSDETVRAGSDNGQRMDQSGLVSAAQMGRTACGAPPGTRTPNPLIKTAELSALPCSVMPLNTDRCWSCHFSIGVSARPCCPLLACVGADGRTMDAHRCQPCLVIALEGISPVKMGTQQRISTSGD
jgi:tetratricopeptide (TPR) repeat protein